MYKETAITFPRRGWSNWHGIKELIIDEKLYKQEGAYVIRAKDRPIHRLGGVDAEGIIHIGQSKNLSRRINAFWISCTEGKEGHMAGWRFYHLGLINILPVDTLEAAWRYNGESYKLEADIMARYTKIFRELPPLNYKYNWASDESISIE